MITPKISIIIPVFNNLSGLIKTVESIQKQSFKNFEVWIMDGGSSLETQDYLGNLEKPFYYQSRVDKGIYDAMNKAISLAKGEWLYFLGSGDVFFEDTVLSSIFEDKASISEDLIAGKVVYEGAISAFVYNAKKKVKEAGWSRFMWIRNGLHHQSTFYKKELFDSLIYQLKYSVLADYWLNLYLYKKGFTCKIINSVVAKCNSDGVSKSGDWSIYQEEIQLKIDLSSFAFKPFYYVIAKIKYLFRKSLNE